MFVSGEVKASRYKDEHDQDRVSYTVYADYVALDTIGLESVVRTAKKAAAKAAA